MDFLELRKPQEIHFLGELTGFPLSQGIHNVSIPFCCTLKALFHPAYFYILLV